MTLLMTDLTLLARRGSGRLIAKLMEGDPVAWTILGGVVVVFGGISLFKKMRNQ